MGASVGVVRVGSGSDKSKQKPSESTRKIGSASIHPLRKPWTGPNQGSCALSFSIQSRLQAPRERRAGRVEPRHKPFPSLSPDGRGERNNGKGTRRRKTPRLTTADVSRTLLFSSILSPLTIALPWLPMWSMLLIRSPHNVFSRGTCNVSYRYSLSSPTVALLVRPSLSCGWRIRSEFRMSSCNRSSRSASASDGM